MFSLATHLSALTFENFSVNKANRLAHAAALAVAEKPGTDYNPFFLHSVSESGSADMHHLLSAIGNRIEKMYPEKTVLYVTGKDLAEIGSDGIGKAAFSNVDVLLLENIQDLAAVSQDDVRLLLEKFSSDGKQLVISSNLPPKDLPMLDFALATQINVGMVIGIAGSEES